MTRNISLDILKIIMAYMVVGLHSGFLADITPTGRYLTVNGLFRVAVPVFFVINGFFFYSVLDTNTSKWFKRALTLYGFWTVFYIYFWFPPTGFTFYSLAKILKTLLVGHNHLWYLPAMIAAAALLCIVRHLSSIILFLLALILFFVGATIQYIGNYHLAPNQALDQLCNTLWIYRSFLFFAFPFFCIGYLLKRTEIYKKITITPLVIFTSIALGLLLTESYLDYTNQPETKGFDIYLSLILVCPLLFLVALSSNVYGTGKSLALYSTGIYFIHPFLIFIFDDVIHGGTALTFVVAVAATLSAAAMIKIDSRLKIML